MSSCICCRVFALVSLWLLQRKKKQKMPTNLTRQMHNLIVLEVRSLEWVSQARGRAAVFPEMNLFSRLSGSRGEATALSAPRGHRIPESGAPSSNFKARNAGQVILVSVPLTLVLSPPAPTVQGPVTASSPEWSTESSKISWLASLPIHTSYTLP